MNPTSTFAQAGVDLRPCTLGKWLADPTTFQRKVCTLTGFPTLNHALGGGWAAGESTNIFGPSGACKSTLIANLALHQCYLNTPALLLTLEMTARDFAKLIAGIDANVRRSSIRHGCLDVDEANRLAASLQKLASAPLHLVDRGQFVDAPTMEAVECTIRDSVVTYGCRVVFIDYLDKIKTSYTDDLSRIPALGEWIYGIVQSTGVHIACLSQTNKEAFRKSAGREGQRHVGLEDVRGPVYAVADFDAAIGLSRADWNTLEQKDPSPLTAAVLKARHGPGGKVPLIFQRKTGRILEAAGMPVPISPARTDGPTQSHQHDLDDLSL